MGDGRNVFISYKYGDTDVGCGKGINNPKSTIDYVIELKKRFQLSSKVYDRSEGTDEDLSELPDERIEQILRDKIFYTSVTIVLMSVNMRVNAHPENNQWIPWEISYSLREQTREHGCSHANAVLAVVIPDRNNSYDYLIESKDCCDEKCTMIYTDRMFPIIKNNMFNSKVIKPKSVGNCKTWSGSHSYIPIVKWDDFISDYDKYIKLAEETRDNIADYNVIKKLDYS
jgi:hypothetical protein